MVRSKNKKLIALAAEDRISLFRRFNQVVGQYTLAQLMAEIRKEKYALPIQQIRAALADGREEVAQALKKQLLAFTPSGQFSGGRRLQFLTRYHPLIVLDLDHLGNDLRACQQCATETAFTRACFTSPSGQGLKIIVATDNPQAEHQSAFAKVLTHYEELLGVKVDPSGKDITRLCFMSYDPEAYYNLTSKIFPTQASPPVIHIPAFAECVAFTERKQNYEKGNRNNFLYLLASNCNRIGLSKSLTLEQMLRHYDLPPPEIRGLVASAYQDRRLDAALLKSTTSVPPTLPHKIFPKLPTLLREACAPFSNPQQRDIFLTAALTVLSAAIPQVRGHYDGRLHFPNLYTAIVAPAKIRETALTFAQTLGMVHHRHLVQQTSLEDIARGKASFRQFYLPPPYALEQLGQHLFKNNGTGLLLATDLLHWQELLVQDRGTGLTFLHKVFVQQALIINRSQSAPSGLVEQPSLSLLLSGTGENWRALKPQIGEGYFDHFLFYVVKESNNYPLSFSKYTKEDWGAYFETLGEEVSAMLAFGKQYPSQFNFSKTQWLALQELLGEEIKRLNLGLVKKAPDLILEMGQICFRLAMILAMCRKYEQGDTRQSSPIEEREFRLACWLVEAYLPHALYLRNCST